MIEKLNNPSSTVEIYPNTTLDKHEAEIESLMLMYATTPKKTFITKRFVDCALGATYKVKSTLDAVIKIRNPTTIAAALSDEHYSYQWRMAIHNELQNKIENDYEFETVTTSQNSRKVIKGVWIFETEANSDTNAIDFKASWVNNDSTKITTKTYKSNITGVNLTNVKVTQRNHVVTHENLIQGFGRCLAMEAGVEPPPFLPTTYEDPAYKSSCSRCSKQHHF